MNLTQITTVLAALGSAAFGGVLFGFSTLVMPGLDDSPPAAAVATMQQINKVAPRSLLAVDMVVTLALCLVVAVAGLFRLRSGGGAGSWLVLLGCLLYAASFAITAIYHIPHNDAFASVVARRPARRAGVARLRPPLGAVEPRQGRVRAGRRGRHGGRPSGPVGLSATAPGRVTTCAC